MVSRWRAHLPPAPQLPCALWGTGGALLLALLSYGFQAELWPGHPAAGGWSLALLPFLLVAGMWQLLRTLQSWIAAVASPGWLRLLLRAGMVVVQVGLALLITAVLLVGLIVLAILA